MRQKSKKRNPKNQRAKQVCATVLACVLCGIIFWPASNEDDLANQTDATSSEATANSPTVKRSFSAPSNNGDLNDIPAITSKQLTRLDHAQIASLDPFLIKEESASQLTDLAPTIGSDLPDSSSAGEDKEPDAPVRVSAVYQTADGAMALIDGKLVPVKDATVLVRTLRSGL